ncbi:unconventional myosin-XVIIIb [Gracilinanus agilis]|uniref:unconventional myosin-XVIIIb n=1 Tax=Gracilinanus agilis TaxID=191870 RepID=UPI001CFCEBEE|nr:unconventional myosin-XVIIIb [Gracilinanus agilis]
MAISSRLALWEQKESIREEDKSPPPSSPPPLFSVIPGGFIRQLVRETEKESKEAKRKKQTLASPQEQPAPENSDSSANKSHTPSGTQSPQGGQPDPASPSPSVVVANIPNESEGMASPEPVLMSSINGEKPQEKGTMETPPRKPQPFKRARKTSDVLLMVAKLNSELPKPEQRTHPGDSPTHKPPPSIPELEGEKKGEPPGDSRDPQTATEASAEKVEKLRPQGLGSSGSTDLPPKKSEKPPIKLGKWGKVSQTKGLKGGEPQSKEEPHSKEGEQRSEAEVKGTEEVKGQIPQTEEKGQLHPKGGLGDKPQGKPGKAGHPKDTVETGKEAHSKAGKGDRTQIQMKKWGESLNRWRKRSESQSQTGKGNESQSQMGKDNESQTQVRNESEPQSLVGRESGPQSQLGKEYDSQGQLGKDHEKGSCPQNEERKEDDPHQKGKSGSEFLKEGKEIHGSPTTEKEGIAPETKKEGKETPVKMEEEEEKEDGERGQSAHSDKELEDRWYEAEKVWLVQKEGFTMATVLKPDVGTPELAAGRVRLCIEADKSITEVDEENVHRANPPELDLAENLASLQSLNESSVLNTLQHRYQAQLLHTYTGPDLIAFQPQGPPAPSSWKAPKGRREGLPPHICALAQKAYWAMLSQRQDQTIVPLGRSGAGKSTCCERALEHLVGSAGSLDGQVSVDKIRATFTILRAFGSVLTGHSSSSTRFSMVMSLDFNATGRVTAAHLQTMLLERVRVAQQPEGEGNFAVFSQMLAGLDLDLRTELYLHQMADGHSFGMGVWAKPEEKQRAAAAFSQLQGAMVTLGISGTEQRAIWRVLAAIYHLGAAGACKVGRKQFMRFEWANYAAEVLGCEYEALTTAVFKHHLQQIIQQATARLNQRNHQEEPDVGYTDHMGFSQFRRQFQALAPIFMKKLLLPDIRMEERKLVEELLQELDLEKAAVLIGNTQVFLKSGIISRLEKQREKLASRNVILFQAACKGFLSRQQFKKLKIRQLAVQCIQRNLAVFQVVKDWPWWQLLCYIRPLLSVTIGEDQLRAKEVCLLRGKLQRSEPIVSEVPSSQDLLQGEITDLTTELSDERFKGEVACRVLESERAERLRASREIQELKSKYEQTQKSLGSVEKQLEEAQQKIELTGVGKPHSGEDDDWRTRFDCALTEIEFLRKRLLMYEERIESELVCRRELEEKLREALNSYEEVRKSSHQLKRKCHNLTCDLEDARILLENQQSRNHELEKRQKKFDMQLTQAIGESLFERGLREKLSQENANAQWELSKLQSRLEETERETLGLKQKLEMLRCHNLDQRGSPLPCGVEAVAALQRQLWDLKSSALEQQQIQNEQENTIKKLEQLRVRFEMEIERMKQTYLKEQEDKEEELEDIRQSCQKRLRQLEMQLEQESEEKKLVLHEKQDLENLIGTLCEQIGHRDFDVEKRLRRDLRRTHALLSDVQFLLTNIEDSQTIVNKEELEKVHKKLEESEAKCADAQNTQKLLAQDLENMHSELENVTKNKNLVDEQLFRLQLEKTDLLKRIDEDQEDLNELMKKHKDLIAQSSQDIMQIQELQESLEEAKKEKQNLQEKLNIAQSRVEHLEKTMVDRSIVGRQEAVICDLENKLEFHKVQIKRFEVLVLRLRDSALKLGEELEKAVCSEMEQKESCQYYQRRMEEMKGEMAELREKEADTSHRCLDLEKRVEELMAVRLTLQADLEVSIRRIADLQMALEDVDSSNSDNESIQTVQESSPTRTQREIDNQSLPESSISSQPLESVRSWLNLSPNQSRSNSTVRSESQQSATGSGVLDQRMHRETREVEKKPPTLRTDAKGDYEKPLSDKSFARQSISPFTFSGQDYNKTNKVESAETWMKTANKSKSHSSTTSPTIDEKPPSTSWALSEFLEGLRKQQTDKEKDALGEEDWPTLPIYQTIGASSLRRSLETATLPEKSALETNLDNPRSGLLRSTSLKCLSCDNSESLLSLPAPSKSVYRSCESLLQSEHLESNFNRNLSSSVGDNLGKFSQSRLHLRRPCIDTPLEEVEDPDLGKESLVFQNRRFSNLPDEPLEPNFRDWKLPRYEQKSKVTFDDYVPAIRKSKSPIRASKDRGDGLKSGASFFKSDASSECLFPGTSSAFQEDLESKEDAEHLSDSSSSSSSAMSYRSADSIKSRPGSLKREEESDRRSRYGTWMDAKRQDEVESIMKKYLQK